jgi:cell division protease FtsH
LIVLLGIWMFLLFANRGPQGKPLSFSEFQTAVDAGNVKTATFLEGEQKITGEFTDGSTYSVTYPLSVQESLTKDMQARGVEVSADAQKGSALLGFLFQLIPVILIVGAFIFIMNQSQGGGGRVMQFGKARAKQVTKDQPKTTFADVAGVDEAIVEVQVV